MAQLHRLLLDRLPWSKRRKSFKAEVEQLRGKLASYEQFVPPGHFYSPIPSLEQVRSEEKRLFGPPPRTLPGIDLREEQQVALLRALHPHYQDLPFPDKKTKGLRYFYENPNYSYGDAIILYSMIRHIRPKRIMEIGSGYSSCAILDTNELFFNNSIDCTFIEPYPDLLYSLTDPGDRSRNRFIARRVQDVELELFGELNEGDILFIDSTHVAKIGSDVNHIFFQVLPRLPRGVYVHFHDIFHPFEYPKDWVYAGIAWSEDYLLRAFLQYNSAFQIEYFATFLFCFYRDIFAELFPLCLKNNGGNIWLKSL